MVFGEHFAFTECNQYFIVGEAAKAETLQFHIITKVLFRNSLNLTLK